MSLKSKKMLISLGVKQQSSQGHNQCYTQVVNSQSQQSMGMPIRLVMIGFFFSFQYFKLNNQL